jgi:hypothetical protein
MAHNAAEFRIFVYQTAGGFERMNPRRNVMCWGIILTLSLFIFGICEAPAQTSGPASKTFLVVGTSLVQKEGLNAAKESAIADCKRTAVEQMTAELLPLEMLVQHFSAINTVIYSQADKFVQYYKMLNELRQGNQYRVLVQAKVSGPMIQERLRSAGILSADARPVAQLSLTVLGTDNLSSFVLFRSSLNKMDGVEGVQIREILPNQTTLAVGYRGTAGAFAEALLREQHDGFSTRVYQESDNAFRIDLTPAAPPQIQE